MDSNIYALTFYADKDKLFFWCEILICFAYVLYDENCFISKKKISKNLSTLKTEAIGNCPMVNMTPDTTQDLYIYIYYLYFMCLALKIFLFGCGWYLVDNIYLYF